MRPLSETWKALQDLPLTELPPALRTRLAELWARDALFEHASIASFSKFTLHLMAIGAPPWLLEQSHQAGIDEIHHARLCFALASAYKGEPLGPGPLPLEGDLLGALDLASITAAAVREGCVGETISSLEAAEAYEAAQSPAPKEALATISQDEARHAELAWKFVRWALEQRDTKTHQAVEQAFREALLAPLPTIGEEDPLDEDLAFHGRFSENRKAKLWRQGLFEVVRPTAEALLGQTF